MKNTVLIVTAFALLAGCVTEVERKEDDAKRTKLVDIHTQLGASYLQRNQLDIAKQELERALEIDSDDSQANNVMGLLQIRLKDDSKAERHFRRAISEMPGNSDARNNYAVFLCERSRYDEADEQFRLAINNPLYKNPEQGNLNAGLCRLKVKDKKGAESYFRAALKANPRSLLGLLHLAKLNLENGQPMSARGLIQRYFEVGPDSPEVLLLAYRIERALSSKDGQDKFALRLRGKFPDSAEAKMLRALKGR